MEPNHSDEIDLQIYRAMLILLVAVNHCDVTKGSIAMMVQEKITSLESKIYDGPVVCQHKRTTSWNHGYHNKCLDCGEYYV